MSQNVQDQLEAENQRPPPTQTTTPTPTASPTPNPHEIDVDGDGISLYVEDRIGTDDTIPNPEIGEINSLLNQDGNLTEKDLRYLRFLANTAGGNETYGKWAQLEELGLLRGMAEDGKITDEELDNIRNNISNIDPPIVVCCQGTVMARDGPGI